MRIPPPLRKLGRFALENNEFWGIPLGLLLFLLTPPLLRLVDPTAGAFDVGVLQSVSFALAAFLLLKGAAWLLLYLDFPEVYRWLDNGLERGFSFWLRRGFGRGARAAIALGIYGLYLLLMVALVAAMV